jgi:hypothetical protein
MKIRNTLVILATAILGSAAVVPSGKAQVTIYDNTENFTGFSFSNAGATMGNKNTYLVADDLTYNPLLALAPVTSFEFSLSNSNTTTQGIMANVLFYDSNGTGGGPGTLLASFTFNPISLATNSVTVVTATLTPLQYFTLPTDGTIWAGIFFSTSTGQSSTILNKFGQGLFNPPTVGTSQDELFYSTGLGPTGSNPAGTIYSSPFGANPPANFGWQLSTTVVPEPASAALFIVGGLGLLLAVQRRRTAR